MPASSFYTRPGHLLRVCQRGPAQPSVNAGVRPWASPLRGAAFSTYADQTRRWLSRDPVEAFDSSNNRLLQQTQTCGTTQTVCICGWSRWLWFVCGLLILILLTGLAFVHYYEWVFIFLHRIKRKNLQCSKSKPGLNLRSLSNTSCIWIILKTTSVTLLILECFKAVLALTSNSLSLCALLSPLLFQTAAWHSVTLR